MAEDGPHIVAALAVACIGAVAHWFLHAISNDWEVRKIAKDLGGKWFSQYQGIDEPEGTWVKELVVLRHRFLSARLILKNQNSSHHYNYTAVAALVVSSHLVGDWESIRPGANAHGAFILSIDSQGCRMYGYWVGPDHNGARRYGRWVLGRDEKELEIAKRQIEAMRQPSPTDSVAPARVVVPL